MKLVTVQYGFQQRFPFSADRAFAWCVDFEPEDVRFMQGQVRRTVRKPSEDIVILRDSRTEAGRPPVVRARLVRIRRSERSWTNTHLVGPNKYSQFWYWIVPDGKDRSHLEYRGLHVERREEDLSPAARAALARQHAKGDAATWRRLAAGMINDLGPRT